MKELYNRYDDYLDEVCDTVWIGTLEYSPSTVFKNVDPAAYECGFNEWLDNQE